MGLGGAEEQDRNQRATPTILNLPLLLSSWDLWAVGHISGLHSSMSPTYQLRHLPQHPPSQHTGSFWARCRHPFFRHVSPPAYLNATIPSVPWVPPTPGHPGLGGQAQGTKLRVPGIRVEWSLANVGCRMPR